MPTEPVNLDDAPEIIRSSFIIRYPCKFEGFRGLPPFRVPLEFGPDLRVDVTVQGTEIQRILVERADAD